MKLSISIYNTKHRYIIPKNNKNKKLIIKNKANLIVNIFINFFNKFIFVLSYLKFMIASFDKAK